MDLLLSKRKILERSCKDKERRAKEMEIKMINLTRVKIKIFKNKSRIPKKIVKAKCNLK